MASVVLDIFSLSWTALALILAVTSWIDDHHGLSTSSRLGVQLLVAGAFSALELSAYSWTVQILSILGIVWVTNLFNFMDGSDGLAGGMATIGFGAFSGAAWMAGDAGLALTCASLSSATLAFMVFNIYPAKIFLGDVGSIPLGFLAVTLGLYGWKSGLWPAWFPFVVFSYFIVDASVTLIRRALRGERVWQAHREHAYQRLIRSGWSHKRLAFTSWSVMLLAGVTALILLHQPTEIIVIGLVGWSIAYAVLLIAVEMRWRRFAATPVSP